MQLLEQEELKREDVLSERDEALAQVCVCDACIARVAPCPTTGGTTHLLAKLWLLLYICAFVDKRWGAETRDEAKRRTPYICGLLVFRSSKWQRWPTLRYWSN